MHTKLLSFAAPMAAALIFAAPANAQNAKPRYIGEIFQTAATYCPAGTLPADGSTLEVAKFQKLFTLITTQYGGNGRTTFALPNFMDTVDKKRRPILTCIVVKGKYPDRGESAP